MNNQNNLRNRPVAKDYEETKLARGTGQLESVDAYLKNDPISYYHKKLEDNPYMRDDFWSEAARRGESEDLINLLQAAGKEGFDSKAYDDIIAYGDRADYDTYMLALTLPHYDDTTPKMRKSEDIFDDQGNLIKAGDGTEFGEYTDRGWAQEILSNTLNKWDAELIEQVKSERSFLENLAAEAGVRTSGHILNIVGGVFNFVGDIWNVGEGLLNGMFNWSGDEGFWTRFLAAHDDESFGDNPFGKIGTTLINANYEFRRQYSTTVNAVEAHELGYKLGEGNWLESIAEATNVGGGQSSWGRWTNGASQAIGYMLPTIILGILTGGSYTAGSVGAKVLAAGQQGLFYAGIFGGMVSDTVNTAKANNISYKDLNAGKVIAQSATKAVVQWAIEKALGAIIGYSGVDRLLGLGGKTLSSKTGAEVGAKLVTQATKSGLSAAGQVVARTLKSSLKEGLEETLQELSDLVIDWTFSKDSDDIPEFSMQNLTDAFMSGALASIVMGAFENANVYKPEAAETVDGQLVKFGHFQKMNMVEAIRKMNEWNETARDSSANIDKRANAINALNMAFSVLGDHYVNMGTDRAIISNAIVQSMVKHSEKAEKIKLLDNASAISSTLISNFVKANKEASDKYLDQKNLAKLEKATKVKAEKLKKAGVKEFKDIITTKVDPDDPNITISKDNIVKLKDALSKFGVEILMGVDGKIVTKSEDVLFVDYDLLKKSDIENIIKGLAYDTAEEAITSKLTDTQKGLLERAIIKFNPNGTLEDAVYALLFDKTFYTYVLLVSADGSLSRGQAYKQAAFDILATIDTLVEEAVRPKIGTNKGQVSEQAYKVLLDKIQNTMRTGIVTFATQYQNLDLDKVSPKVLPPELKQVIRTHRNVIFTALINEGLRDKNNIPLPLERIQKFDEIVNKFSEIMSVTDIEAFKKSIRSVNYNDRVDAIAKLVYVIKNEANSPNKLIYLPADATGALEQIAVEELNSTLGVNYIDFVDGIYNKNKIAKLVNEFASIGKFDETLRAGRLALAREVLYRKSGQSLTLGYNGELMRVINKQDFTKPEYLGKEGEVKLRADLKINKLTVKDISKFKLDPTLGNIKLKLNAKMANNTRGGYYIDGENTIYLATNNMVNNLMHELTHVTQYLLRAGSTNEISTGGGAMSDFELLPNTVQNSMRKYVKENFPLTYGYLSDLLKKNDHSDIGVLYFMLDGEIQANADFNSVLFETGFSWKKVGDNPRGMLIPPNGKEQDGWLMKPSQRKKGSSTTEASRKAAGTNETIMGLKGASKDLSLYTKLLEAKRLYKTKTMTNNEIVKETGWYLSKDNNWKHEISDHHLSFKFDDMPQLLSDIVHKLLYNNVAPNLRPKTYDSVKTTYKLGDFIHHWNLFSYYPFLRTTELIFEVDESSASLGSFNPANGNIEINLGGMLKLTNDQSNFEYLILDTLVHEIQHAIQQYEGFAEGGSVEMVSKKMVEDIKKDLARISPTYIEAAKQTQESFTLLKEAMATNNIDLVKKQRTNIDKNLEIMDQEFYDYVEANDLTDDFVFSIYENLLGENEARWAAKFRHMTEEDLDRDRVIPKYEKGSIVDLNKENFSILDGFTPKPKLVSDNDKENIEAFKKVIGLNELYVGLEGAKVNEALHDNLLEAQKLHKAKDLDMKEISEKTGWYLSKDNNWKYTIDDSNFKFKIKNTNKLILNIVEKLKNKENINSPNYEDVKTNYRLSDFIEHPELFKYYPHIQYINLRFEYSQNASYGGYYKDNGIIVVNVYNYDKMTKYFRLVALTDVVIHEIQHAIQYHEGFAYSASPKYIDEQINYVLDEVLNKISPEYIDAKKQLKKLDKLEEISVMLVHAHLADDTEVLDKYKDFNPMEVWNQQDKYHGVIANLVQDYRKTIGITPETATEVYNNLLAEHEARTAGWKASLGGGESKTLPRHEINKKTIIHLKDFLNNIKNQAKNIRSSSKLINEDVEFLNKRYFTQKFANMSNLKYWNKTIRQADPKIQEFVIATTGKDFDKLPDVIKDKILDGELTMHDITYFVATSTNTNNYTFKMIAKHIYRNEELAKLTHKQMMKLADDLAEFAIDYSVLKDDPMVDQIMTQPELSQLIIDINVKAHTDQELEQELLKARKKQIYKKTKDDKISDVESEEGSTGLELKQIPPLFFNRYDGTLSSLNDIYQIHKFILYQQAPLKKASASKEAEVDSTTTDGILTAKDTISKVKTEWGFVDRRRIADIEYDYTKVPNTSDIQNTLDNISKFDKIDALVNNIEKVILEKYSKLSKTELNRPALDKKGKPLMTEEGEYVRVRDQIMEEFNKETDRIHELSPVQLDNEYSKLMGAASLGVIIETKIDSRIVEGPITSVTPQITNVKNLLRQRARTVTRRIADLKRRYNSLSDLVKANIDPTTYKLNTNYQKMNIDQLMELSEELSQAMKKLNNSIKKAEYDKAAEERAQKRLQRLAAKELKAKEALEKVKEKTKTIREKITRPFKTSIRGQKFTFRSNVEPNLIVKQLLDTQWAKTRMSTVKGVTNNVEQNVHNGKLFFEQNANTISKMSTSEAEAVADWFMSATIADTEGTSTEAQAFTAIRLYILGHIYSQSSIEGGQFMGFNSNLRQKLEDVLKRFATGYGTGLSVWKNIQGLINPIETMINAEMILGGVVIGDDEKSDLANAIFSNDYNEAQRVIARIINRISDEKLPKKEILRKISVIRSMSMLSGPMTWVRNSVSNIILKRLNKWSAKIAEAILPTSKQQNQTKMTGEITPEIQAYIEAQFVNTGLFDLIIDNLSKYNPSDIRAKFKDASGRATRDAITTQLVIKAMYNQYYNQNMFSTEGMNKVHRFLMNRLSDNNYVREAAIRYFGKFLAEHKYQLTTTDTNGNIEFREVSTEIMNDFASALGLAMSDYMHSDNIFTKVETTLAEHSEGLLFAYKLILPFAKAQWNWFKAAIRYSPVGLGQSIIKLANLENEIRKAQNTWAAGKSQINPELTETLIRRDFGSGIIGTTAMIFGMILAGLGYVELEDDDYGTPKLRIGNIRIDLSTIFGSSSTLAGMALVQGWRENGNALEGLNAMLDPVLDGFFMTQILELDKYSYDGFASTTINFAEQLILSFWPNLLRYISGATYTGKYKTNNLFKRTIARIPFFNLAFEEIGWLDKETNPYTGNYEGTIWDIFNRMIPYLEVRNTSILEDKSKALGINKTQLRGNYEVNGEEFKLKANEVGNLNKMYGQWNAQVLTMFYNNESKHSVLMPNGTYKTLSYNQMSEYQRRNVVQKLFTKHAEYAKIWAWLETGNSYYASLEEYKAMKKLNFTGKLYKGNKGFVKN